jgi:hypothetical protein
MRFISMKPSSSDQSSAPEGRKIEVRRLGSSLFTMVVDVRPRCRGKIWNSRTQERERCGFTIEETDGLGDWVENCRAVGWLQNRGTSQASGRLNRALG